MTDAKAPALVAWLRDADAETQREFVAMCQREVAHGHGHLLGWQSERVLGILEDREAQLAEANEYIRQCDHKLDFTNKESTFNRLNEQRQEMISRALAAESQLRASALRIQALELELQECSQVCSQRDVNALVVEQVRALAEELDAHIDYPTNETDIAVHNVMAKVRDKIRALLSPVPPERTP